MVQQMDKDADKKGVEKYLARFNWPPGSCLHSINKIPIHFMICGNLGSVSTKDGHKLQKRGPMPEVVGCSRWDELSQTIRYRARLLSRGLL